MHIVVLEVDEHQHKAVSYTERCDWLRMGRITDTYITESDVTLPVHFIRYNSDGYFLWGRQMKTQPSIRMNALKELLLASIADNDTSHRMIVHHLYYDGQEEHRTLKFKTVAEFESCVDSRFPFTRRPRA